MHHRETYLKRVHVSVYPGEDERFPFPKMRVPAPGRVFSQTPATTASSRSYYWITSNSPLKPTTRRTHSARFANSCARIKTGKLKEKLFSGSVVFVFVLDCRRRSWLLVTLLFLVCYPLFSCTECLYQPSQSPGPHAPTNARSVATLLGGWNYPSHWEHHLYQHRHVLTKILLSLSLFRFTYSQHRFIHIYLRSKHRGAI